MLPYRTHPAAAQDAKLAYAHYRGISQQLSRRFKAELRVAVNFIRRFPEASPDLGDGVRRKLFRRPFLYAVWYTLEERDVVIWAVGHQHREPGFWSVRRTGEGTGAA